MERERSEITAQPRPLDNSRPGTGQQARSDSHGRRPRATPDTGRDAQQHRPPTDTPPAHHPPQNATDEAPAGRLADTSRNKESPFSGILPNASGNQGATIQFGSKGQTRQKGTIQPRRYYNTPFQKINPFFRLELPASRDASGAMLDSPPPRSSAGHGTPPTAEAHTGTTRRLDAEAHSTADRTPDSPYFCRRITARNNNTIYISEYPHTHIFKNL